jgi:hypothetical protein
MKNLKETLHANTDKKLSMFYETLRIADDLAEHIASDFTTDAREEIEIAETELRRLHDLLGKANALARIRAERIKELEEELERLRLRPFPELSIEQEEFHKKISSSGAFTIDKLAEGYPLVSSKDKNGNTE